MIGRPVVLIGDTTNNLLVTITGRMFHMAQGQQPPGGETPPGQASQYEYTTYYVPYSHHHPDVIARMNELGGQGWLLCAVASGYMYFVRELK